MLGSKVLHHHLQLLLDTEHNLLLLLLFVLLILRIFVLKIKNNINKKLFPKRIFFIQKLLTLIYLWSYCFDFQQYPVIINLIRNKWDNVGFTLKLIFQMCFTQKFICGEKMKEKISFFWKTFFFTIDDFKGTVVN